MDNISEEIKESIKSKGYLQQQFAEEVLGIKRLALYRKLKGEVPFNKLEKEKIEQILNIKIE